MANIQKLGKGARSNIISERYGGDPVDVAINNIHKKTGQPITSMVKRGLVLYSDVIDTECKQKDQLKTAVKLNQKRHG